MRVSAGNNARLLLEQVVGQAAEERRDGIALAHEDFDLAQGKTYTKIKQRVEGGGRVTHEEGT